MAVLERVQLSGAAAGGIQPELFSSSWECGGITLADAMPGEEFHLPIPV